jgi:hypothetical protein
MQNWTTCKQSLMYDISVNVEFFYLNKHRLWRDGLVTPIVNKKLSFKKQASWEKITSSEGKLSVPAYHPTKK